MLLAHKFAVALQEKLNDSEGEQAKRFPGFIYLLEVESGKKFDKIVISYTTEYDRERGREGSRSVHAFVERETGALIKAATYKAPAKIKTGWATKYNLESEFETALAVADPYGGYLYQ
jgi:hypothetical protein